MRPSLDSPEKGCKKACFERRVILKNSISSIGNFKKLQKRWRAFRSIPQVILQLLQTIPFLKFTINNAGDPFLDSLYYRINTHKIEREVIDLFAELFYAPENNYWGYVTKWGN